jgi:RND family efflux transporter MFP subunit
MSSKHVLKTQVFWLLVIICCFSVSTVMAQNTASPVTVSVTTPRRGTFVSAKDYTGHLQPNAEVKVFANVSGKLVSIETQVGQSVTKGDVLAQSSAKETTLAVIRAESALSSAQSQLTTTEASAQARIESQLAVAQEALMAAQAKLIETKSLAEMRIRNQLTQAETAYQAAEATIERSKINAEQALQRAKVELDKNRLEFERNKALHEKQHISDSNFEAVERSFKVSQTRYEEAVVTAAQFKEGATHPSVEKAKAELAVAQKVVESRGWEREIASAESKVTQAQASLNTAQKLVEAKSWEHEIAIAKAAVTQASEQLKLAREKLSDATIKSPIDGIVATQHLNAGDYAQLASSPTGKPVFTVVAVDMLKAVWNMPVGDARRITNGALVLISTDSGIRNIVGTIVFISPTVNRDNNTVLVHATVPNAKNHLKSGTAITISIKTGERKNVQLLPLRSVLNIQNGSGTIFVVEGNVAGTKQVNVGGVHSGEIEVTSQLARGTRVIVDNQHRLQDGAKVSVASD